MRIPLAATLLSLSLGLLVSGGPAPTPAPAPAPAALVARQDAAAAAAASLVTVITESGTPTTVTVEPSPTGLGACELHIDHWHCDGPAAPATAASLVTVITESGTPTTVTVEPSPTGLGACHLHGDHWHCDEEDAHAEEGHDHSGHSHAESESASAENHAGHSHSSGSHAGHSHGPSAEFGCSLAPLEAYDLPLHIGAIFILLASAGIGTFLPILFSSRSPPGSRGILAEIFFICKHFGTGIILATAFVHLLSHAMLYFANECIGAIEYEGTVPAIAMGAVWTVFVVDFFLLRALRAKAHAEAAAAAAAEAAAEKDASSSDSGSIASSGAERRVATWDLVALEAGIIFHSILIGVTLGTATGAGFTALLVAITFHQFFEGIALGSRIACLAHLGAAKKAASGLAYTLTTPLGIAIGIGVRNSFNANDRSTLLTQGILHAISAGILLYTALVELMAGDFIHGRGLANASTARCIAAVAALTVGAAAMSVLGKWA